MYHKPLRVLGLTEKWQSVWNDLALMKGLSPLTVMIGHRRGCQEEPEEYLTKTCSCCGIIGWVENEADLLKEATKIVDVDFRLILSWPQGSRELPKINGVVERCTDRILER